MDEGNHIAAMEKLLQQAFNLHKESSRGMSSNLVKTKTQYYKTLERCQELQKQNEDLIVQNKQLKQLLENQQNSCPNCSKVITVDSSSVDSQSNTSPHIKPSSTSNSAKRSSTSNSAKRSSTSTHGEPLSTSTQKTSPGISSEDDVLDFGEDCDRTTEGNRKLHRRHNKKRKYFEDVSPELKRARQTSPKISPDNKVVDSEPKSFTSSQKFQPKQDNEVKSKKSVLVPDTCDDSSSKNRHSKSDKIQHSKKDKTRHSKSDQSRHSHTGVNGTGDAASDDDHELDLGVIDNLSVLVVPETMAMDGIGIELYPDVGVNRRRFGADLSDIAEDQETLNSQLELDSTLVDSNSDSIVRQHTALLSKSDSNLKQPTEKQRTGLHSKNDNKSVKQGTAPNSFIHSIIDSPDPVCKDKSRRDPGSVKDKSEKDKSGTASGRVTAADKLLCENSDSESEEDKIPCSHTFNKPKIQLHRIEHKHTDTTQSMASHRKSARHSRQSSPDVKTKTSKHSPTYKKEGRKLSHLDDDADVILRRSPRKHKNSPLTTPTKSSSRRCLSKESPATVEKHGKLSSSQSECERKFEGKDQGRTSKNILNESEIGMNETADFTQESESTTLQDNQSMDCYTVMPLKNGQLDAGNQFQVNVTKDKHNKNKNVKNKPNKTSPVSPNMNMNNLDETLKSPSILNSDRKVFSQNSIQGGGSSGDSSQSLSLSVVSSKVNKSRDITRDVEVIDLDWMSKKGGSQELGSRSQQRSNPRSAQRGKNKIRKSGNLYSFNFEPSDSSTKVNVQNLHQTTLTQGFFSPKQKSKDKSEMSENRKSENSDDKSPGLFKKPLFKADKRSKTKNKEHDVTTNVTTTDELDVPGPVPGSALTDITLDTAHSMNIDNDLNGSIDPGAELTPWNDEPPSLPSLETDMENIDPEPNDLTMENSFDCRPKKPGNKIAHVAVVRKQDERQKLQGHGCKQCLEYYKSTGRSDEEIKNHMCQCSRHRAAYVPPDTPPHFWSIGFIDTQESNNESGKKKAADKEEGGDLPSYRRRKRLNKYFKAKNEMSYQENSEEIMEL